MSTSERLALGLGALALLLSLAPLGQVLAAVHALEVRELEAASDALLPAAAGPGALRLVSAELGVDDEVTFEVCSSSALPADRYGGLLGTAILRITAAGDEEVVRAPLDAALLAHARRSSEGACLDVGRGVIEVAGTYVTELTWSDALPEEGVRFRGRTLARRALVPSDRNLVFAVLLSMLAASLVLYVRPLRPIAATRPLRSALAVTGAGAAMLWVLMRYVTPMLPRGAAWGLAGGVLLALVEVALAFVLAGALRLDVLALGHRPAESDALWMRARPFALLALAPVFGIALHRVAQIALRVVPSTGEAPIEAFVAWPSGMLSFAALAVVAPLAEEVFFRGMVYGVLAGDPKVARPARALGAAFGSWLLFALVHLPQTWGSWGGMLAIAIAALGFTVLRVISGSVLVPALAHLVYNGLLSAEGLLGLMLFPLAAISILRLIKHLAAMALMAGVVGAFLPRALEDRQRAAYFVAGPAWGVAVATGFLLTWARGISLLSGWVLASLVLAIVDLQFVLFAVGAEGRRTPLVATLAIGTLVGIVALMIYQPG